MKLPRVRFTVQGMMVGAILAVAVGGVAFWRRGCGPDDYDPNQFVHTGEAAKSEIMKWAHRAIRLDPAVDLPRSASDFWLFDGGSFGGSITYWTFRCDRPEDCLSAVAYLGGLRPADLSPWTPSRYAVVMEGPGFYSARGGWKPLRSDPWDVRGIRHGLAYESVEGDHERMVYFAIDLDRNRVYYHRESGGFPAVPTGRDPVPGSIHQSRNSATPVLYGASG